MDLLTTVLFITTFLLIAYLYLKLWCLTYWKRHGFPYIEPEFLYGNIREQLSRNLSMGDQFMKFYNHFKSKGHKHGGVYSFFTPVYLPVDLEIIKCILQKDFGNFVNHGMYVNEEIDPLTGHLFNLEDEKWRNMRVKLTPTFTSGKMKMMFQTMVQCTYGLSDILKDHSIVQDPIDVKDVVSRFTTDVIGSCAFGIDCDSLKNPNSEFRQFGKKIFEPNFIRRMKFFMFLLIPRRVMHKLRIKQTNTEIESFFMNVVKDTVEYREKNNVFRRDFMQLMLQLKNKGKVADDETETVNIDKQDGAAQKMESLTMNEVAAQCFVFFLAGFETSATTMTFSLLELALNEDIQDKLRQEIVEVLQKHNGELTYEAVMEMTYLDRVVNETLRRHPPLPGTPRVCNKQFKIPDTDLTLEPGVRIHIPFQAIHMDPDYYPDPKKFDPDRFNEENKAQRPAYAFMPFGEGPRICIGSRFGLMQAKVGILSIVKDYRVTLNEKTKTPIKYSTKAFITSVDGGVWLNVTKIDTLNKN